MTSWAWANRIPMGLIYNQPRIPPPLNIDLQRHIRKNILDHSATAYIDNDWGEFMQLVTALGVADF